MKRILFFLICGFMYLTVSAQTTAQKALADAYLDRYAAFAVEEMQRSGVPASITLAQGMLESSYGRSELAQKANNHFGIQCHGDAWKGKRYSHMDAGEMREFRKYKSVLHSYEDHSDFLVTHNRYSQLFELDRTDYKGWAHGLKSAGYAEDPEYAAKLIRVIEMYDLDQYDTMTQVKPGSKKRDKTANKSAKDASVVEAVEKPQSKSEPEHRGRTCSYPLSREMYSQNDVPFVYAYEGEKYSDIARHHGLFLGEILSFNDASVDCALPKGAVVYLQAKKRKAAKGYDFYVVEEGMDMQDISQKFAVKLRRLCRMNKVEADHVPQAGDTIRLR
jgi:hypothetical protein